jgi:actin-related protein 8
MLLCLREYLKRDDQILVFRLQNEENRNRMTREAKDRDRALAQSNRGEFPLPEADVDMEEEAVADEGGAPVAGEEVLGSKVVVIHPGSQNLRIGLASDALPRTIPMVIARKWEHSESEEDGSEPRPKRMKADDDDDLDPEQLFGAEVRIHMRMHTSKQRTDFW